MAQQETITQSDAVTVEAEPATDRQRATAGGGESARLARARDNERTVFADALPDTQRGGRVVADWWQAVRDTAVGLRDGSFWDEQPPSPRELYDRWRQSRWTHSIYWPLRWARMLGFALSVVWSVPLYGLAIAGQRFGRALLTGLTIYMLFHLI